VGELRSALWAIVNKFIYNKKCSPEGGQVQRAGAPFRGPLPPRLNALPYCGGAGVGGSGGKGAGGGGGKPPGGRKASNLLLLEKYPQQITRGLKVGRPWVGLGRLTPHGA